MEMVINTPTKMCCGAVGKCDCKGNVINLPRPLGLPQYDFGSPASNQGQTEIVQVHNAPPNGIGLPQWEFAPARKAVVNGPATRQVVNTPGKATHTPLGLPEYSFG